MQSLASLSLSLSGRGSSQGRDSRMRKSAPPTTTVATTTATPTKSILWGTLTPASLSPTSTPPLSPRRSTSPTTVTSALFHATTAADDANHIEKTATAKTVPVVPAKPTAKRATRVASAPVPSTAAATTSTERRSTTALQMDTAQQACIDALSILLRLLKYNEIATDTSIEQWRQHAVILLTSANEAHPYQTVLLEIAEYCDAVAMASQSSRSCSAVTSNNESTNNDTVEALLLDCWTALCSYSQLRYKLAYRHYATLRRLLYEQQKPLALLQQFDDDNDDNHDGGGLSHSQRQSSSTSRLTGLSRLFSPSTTNTNKLEVALDQVEAARVRQLIVAEECCTSQRHCILAQRNAMRVKVTHNVSGAPVNPEPL